MFTYFEPDTAPKESKPLMKQSLAGFGMTPNLQKILPEAPVNYKALQRHIYSIHERHNAESN
ncbi:hypothetical protein [Salinimonas chungwhensis]|uniref:hypothetical protein n=1 Tax=Salinimonas chungwhensis TaxID=265425 RepID=UPI0003A56753|nr:hypothetical protein [Salinimonas chungwhensis]